MIKINKQINEIKKTGLIFLETLKEKELTNITTKISEIKEKQSIDSMIPSDSKLELDKIMEIIDDKINNLNSSITNKINE